MSAIEESFSNSREKKTIAIIGIGCSLYCDQGFGIAVIERLHDHYVFPENVLLVDGGTAGVSLTGLIAQSDHVIAVDAMRNGGKPGQLYRLEGDRIFQRLTMKNHVQHVEFLEGLAHCQALDDPPEAVLLGIEPEDTDTVVCALTPALQNKTETVMKLVLTELDRLKVTYFEKGNEPKCV